MCARFTLRLGAQAVKDLFGLDEAPEMDERYNIAPTQEVPAVATDKEGRRRLRMLRWGLVPYWAKDLSIGQKLINAKAETVHEKPAFRAAFQRRRCLIPADGFYEWKEVEEVAPGGKKPRKRKQPYLIARRDGRPFAFAGLYDFWKDPQGEPVESCTILTTEPNAAVAPLHDRMPVILREEDFDLWLDRAIQEREPLEPLLHPVPAEMLSVRPVNPLVGNPNNEGPELWECPPGALDL
jgi:putative SOS response-associated peptidase YedK